MSDPNNCSSSPIRAHFSDITNKKITIEDDCRWKLPSAAPIITIENDENENEAWNEYRHIFETSNSQMLNPSSMDNYFLRHSSANTSLNESTSFEPLMDNNDDIFSIIEQAGITFDALTGSSSSTDLLASTSGYHSYEPSPFNHRLKRSSVLDPSAAEFHLESESSLTSNYHQSNKRSSCHSDLQNRRTSRSQNPTTQRIPTSYEYKFGGYGRGINEFLEPNGITFLSDGTIGVVDTNSSQVKLFDPVRRECILKFGQAGTRPGALLYPYRVAVLPGRDLLVMVQRSPRPMIQIFDRNGQFISRFGNDLESPRAICIDQQGRIIVIESKIMKVHIYDATSGRIWGQFDLRDHLSFPTSVCVNDRHELYVSDNESHFVRVFDYNGQHLKNIGAGISYPIACRINQPRRELIVVDNHENFNVTTYDYDGNKKYSHYSLMKHSQCFDVAVGYNDELAMASKDYKIYVYKLGEGLETAAPSSDINQNYC
ncbi:unnamed protein product [Rotaria magnacalcarata]|uniref:Uncharacterized protein n=15 Tax=Rotaria TaxID=231623 RepID=A0A816FH69_9BILA|nr:unnamed protein product [Rotaria magnacalcarata]CAF1661516.1 unnamed protein product [Rotaria magnacalcarata]CAF2023618.1 unnamed protein product [Rotaria magnacalcarata]CAF2052949.1 unnamed protein product [Rotaria magnacalcarata]CAF2187231.1 unnamed protein product [Rotaria magnacalcarata]